MGMLQTAVRHSYLRSEVGVLSRFPVARMRALFAALEAEALAEAKEEGFAPASVKLTRLIDLRYPHQGYTLGVECPAVLADDDGKAKLKNDFDDLHARVYGQSAPGEDAEIVTFRLQAEIEVPKLELAPLPSGDGTSARARTGERPLFDVDADRFMTAGIYDRAKLAPGDIIAGPAVIEQFDATTLILAGQTATVDRYGLLIMESAT
jgi:N-methylhydantoinase A